MACAAVTELSQLNKLLTWTNREAAVFILGMCIQRNPNAGAMGVGGLHFVPE